MDYAARVSLLVAWILGSISLVGVIVWGSVGLFNEKDSAMNQPTFGSVSPNSSVITRTNDFRSGPDGLDLGGVSHVSPNTNIYWKSVAIPDSEGATVASVLQAASDRMQFLQKSPHASNSQAKALWHLEQALNVLEGRTDFTDSILGGEPK